MNDYINKVIQGDCLEVLKTLPDNSIDSIVTDPPYNTGMSKKKLLGILKNPNDKLIAVDLDGTLCSGECWTEEAIFNAEPILEMVNLINKLYIGGGHIIINTARPECYRYATEYWLNKNGIRYHAIIMNTRKVGADLYIEDKSLNVDDILCINQK